MYRAIPVGNVLPEKILYPAASLRSQNRKMYLSYDPPLAIFCCDGDGIFFAAGKGRVPVSTGNIEWGINYSIG